MSERKELGLDILYLAPQLIIYLLMTIAPFFVALPIMFTDQVSVNDAEFSWVGVRNLVDIFSEPIRSVFLPALGRTAVFVLLNYLMIYLFGMTLALLMYEFRRSRVRRPFFTVIFLPYMLSGLGTGMLMGLLFSRDSGSVNLLLQHLGVLQNPIDVKDPLVSSFALPILVGWRYAGLNMAIFLSGLLAIPESTIESAEMDGCNYPQKLWYIYLPQMMSNIIMASIFCIIGSFGLVDEPIGMGGLYANKNAEFLGIIFLKFGLISGEYTSGTLAQAISMSMTVYIPLLLVAFVLTRLQKRLQY